MAKSYTDHPITDRNGKLGVLQPSEELDFDVPRTPQPLNFFTRLLQLLLALAGLAWSTRLVSDVALASISTTSTSWGAAYDRSQTAGTFVFMSSALVLLMLVVWTTRAYRNLDAASLADESPTQVLFYWFIPAINLLLPATVLEELYLASRGKPAAPGARNRPPLVWFCWFAGPLMILIRLIFLQIRPMVFPSGRLATMLDLSEWAADAAIASACVAAIVLVGRVAAAKAF